MRRLAAGLALVLLGGCEAHVRISSDTAKPEREAERHIGTVIAVDDSLHHITCYYRDYREGISCASWVSLAIPVEGSRP